MQWKKLQRWMPGLDNFAHYRKEWFSHDLLRRQLRPWLLLWCSLADGQNLPAG
ncbi:hypothetical protein ACSLVK_01425 [Photorhabdus tasmaniensis]|uniref:hypothetical protein n=1 Tax=Photorhabdus tasmaniensis TaxID=1004159 RepID=UPI004040FCD5